MAILSIQSWVASGHVGNAAALPVLHAFGHEVWSIHTVIFSNHPAHGAHTGRVTAAAEVADLVAGLERRGLLARCRAVLSGYLGTAATGATVLETVGRIKAARPGSLYCLDPVIGDGGRRYVAPGIAEFFRNEAVGAADLVVANAYEAEILTGCRVHDRDSARKAAELLRRVGPSVAVVTGIAAGSGIANLVVGPEGAWQSRTARRAVAAHGAGDVFTAAFLGRFLQCDGDAAAALGAATAAVDAVLSTTERRGGDGDLVLVGFEPPENPAPVWPL